MTISQTRQVQLRGLRFTVRAEVDPGDSLTVALTPLHATDQPRFLWRGAFAPQYIEEVTAKTGNFKRFSVFCEMLLSSLDADLQNKTLALNLITVADLADDDSRAGSTNPMVSTSLSPEALASLDKVYLVMTYSSAFDRIHYPLPLQMSVPLNRQQGQQDVENQFAAASEPVKSAHRPHSQQQTSNPPLPNSNPQYREAHLEPLKTRQANENFHSDAFRDYEEELQRVKDDVMFLRSQISDLKRERALNLEEIQRLMKENDRLQLLVKHHKSQSQRNTRPIPLDQMPDALRTLFKGVADSQNDNIAFKKSILALQRVVAGLLADIGQDQIEITKVSEPPSPAIPTLQAIFPTAACTNYQCFGLVVLVHVC
ncbi:Coiled-coil domain-containing protein 61 [Entophlyctis sp. JEL0112]|nr:Coiled-coil domain-containing protein 61 [Entophlyctis sp. JEL0112]